MSDSHTTTGPRKKAVDPTSLLDAPAPRRRHIGLFAGFGAAAVHAGLFALALTASSWPRSAQTSQPVPVTELTELIEVIPEPEPPPEPEPEPAKPEPEPEPPRPKVAIPKSPKLRDPKPEQAPPPAAAEAAKVLAKEPELLDFGETFVQGNSATYAGGVTEAGGTSKVAVRDANARAHGVIGGKGTSPTPVDLSREASLADGLRWDCPFPEEADSEGLDQAVVSLKVRVAASGSVESVDVAKDPGFGFGREARRCALRKRWQPARNRAGQPIAKVSTLNIRFQR